MIEIENQKKEFDSTVCFTFFSDWLEAIEDAEVEADRESEAYMLFKAIANYSLFDEEPDFEGCKANKPFKRFWPMLTRQIKASRKSRKRGFSDTHGPTEKAKAVIEAFANNPQASLRDIEKITGVSKSEVSRIKRKYLTPAPVASAPAVPVSTFASNPSPDTGANPTTGHGTEKDTGQDAESEATTSWMDALLDEDKALLENREPLPF